MQFDIKNPPANNKLEKKHFMTKVVKMMQRKTLVRGRVTEVD